MGEQLVQGRYAAARGRFEPATFRLQDTEHTATPQRPITFRLAIIKIMFHFILWISFTLYLLHVHYITKPRGCVYT